MCPYSRQCKGSIVGDQERILAGHRCREWLWRRCCPLSSLTEVRGNMSRGSSDRGRAHSVALWFGDNNHSSPSRHRYTRPHAQCQDQVCLTIQYHNANCFWFHIHFYSGLNNVDFPICHKYLRPNPVYISLMVMLVSGVDNTVDSDISARIFYIWLQSFQGEFLFWTMILMWSSTYGL